MVLFNRPNPDISKLLEKHKTNANTKATKGQKMLLLYYLGFLDKIAQLNTTAGNKVKLLSKIIDANSKNVQKDFNGRGIHLDSQLSSESNYKYVIPLLFEMGLEKEAEDAEIMLEKIKSKRQKKK